MNRLEKRRKKTMRKNNISIIDSNSPYEKARVWGEHKATKLILDFLDTKKEYNVNALNESIKMTHNYGHNQDIKITKNGVKLDKKNRMFFRIASKSMSKTKREFNNYGHLPTYVDLMKDYLNKHPEDMPTTLDLRRVSRRTQRKHHKKTRKYFLK